MILTQEQEMIRDSMRAFAQERLAPFAAEWDKTHAFPAEALKELGELGAMGTKSRSLERSLIFTGKIQDAVEVGIGNLVDADLAKESAKLQSLQTKQQLGVQALSIANQTPQSILSLFKG